MRRRRPKFEQKSASEAPLGGTFGPSFWCRRAIPDLQKTMFFPKLCRILYLLRTYKGLTLWLRKNLAFLHSKFHTSSPRSRAGYFFNIRNGQQVSRERFWKVHEKRHLPKAGFCIIFTDPLRVRMERKKRHLKDPSGSPDF